MKFCWHKYKVLKNFGEKIRSTESGKYIEYITHISVWKCEKCGKQKTKYHTGIKGIPASVVDDYVEWGIK